MESKLQERAPEARCYACGTAAVARMCHHCGRLGCGAHVTPTPVIAGRALSTELSGMGMGSKPAYHCGACLHAASRAALAVGLSAPLVLLAGLCIVWFALIPGLVLIIGAAGAATVGYVASARRRTGRPRLPMPVLPRVDDISLTEELRGQITLSQDGEYTSRLEPVEGRLKVALAFGRPDRQRHESYLRKHRLGRDHDVRFTAGALVFRGRVGITLSGDFPQLVIPLDGSTGGYAIFDPDRQRSASVFPVEHVYRLTEEHDQDRAEAPVWIVPAIAPHSDKRALELQIQWGHDKETGPDLVLESIEALTVRYPQSWGEFERATGGVIVGTGEEPAIEWRHLSPDRHQRERKRIDLVAQFDSEIDPDSTVRGRLDVLFTGAISGIEGLRFFGPLGNSRTSAAVDAVKTHVLLDFELSLKHTRYQSVRLVPDRSEREGADRERSDEYAGVIPNDATVIALTNALADDGYYVKRVIENPPRSGTRANLVRRYWDIAGRRYEGVYPIDFHIILTGEEVHRGAVGAYTGVTKTRLTVQGSYANPDMEERVTQAWKALHTMVEETLCSQLRSDPRTTPMSE